MTSRIVSNATGTRYFDITLNYESCYAKIIPKVPYLRAKNWDIQNSNPSLFEGPGGTENLFSADPSINRNSFYWNNFFLKVIVHRSPMLCGRAFRVYSMWYSFLTKSMRLSAFVFKPFAFCIFPKHGSPFCVVVLPLIQRFYVSYCVSFLCQRKW